jgi:hypothetical protein
MKSDECYHAPLDSSYLWFIPKRRFFTPWVWDLYGVLLDGNGPDTVASNISRGEALGLLKLLNAYNVGD